jgi:hypothetical protein
MSRIFYQEAAAKESTSIDVLTACELARLITLAKGAKACGKSWLVMPALLCLRSRKDIDTNMAIGRASLPITGQMSLTFSAKRLQVSSKQHLSLILVVDGNVRSLY